jgi:hypothetical protein
MTMPLLLLLLLLLLLRLILILQQCRTIQIVTDAAASGAGLRRGESKIVVASRRE